MSANGTPPSTRTKLLWDIYDRVYVLKYTDREQAITLLRSIQGHLDEYTGPADTWYNLGVDCARLHLRDIEWEAYWGGLEEWPQNVDLLCSVLQEYYGPRENPPEAARIWATLEAMPLAEKAPYWRYWVYGATYHAIYLRDREKGLRLLDQGLLSVRRDALMDILRSYRRILLDAAPRPFEMPAEYDEELIESEHSKLINEHSQNVQIVIDRYKLGLELGVENGYELAHLLAKLYQEMAYKTAANANDGSGPDNLQEALHMLEYAEKMFTDDSNHPLEGIYADKINVLMGLNRFAEAFELLQSLEKSSSLQRTQRLQLERAARGAGISQKEITDHDLLAYIVRDNGRSLAAMALRSEELREILHSIDRFAVQGEPASQQPPQAEPAEETEEDGQKAIGEALNFLLTNPEVLLRIAQEHAEVGTMIKLIAQRLED